MLGVLVYTQLYCESSVLMHNRDTERGMIFTKIWNNMFRSVKTKSHKMNSDDVLHKNTKHSRSAGNLCGVGMVSSSESGRAVKSFDTYRSPCGNYRVDDGVFDIILPYQRFSVGDRYTKQTTVSRQEVDESSQAYTLAKTQYMISRHHEPQESGPSLAVPMQSRGLWV